jgi:fibronectin type 3 domain-containing protein
VGGIWKRSLSPTGWTPWINRVSWRRLDAARLILLVACGTFRGVPNLRVIMFRVWLVFVAWLFAPAVPAVAQAMIDDFSDGLLWDGDWSYCSQSPATLGLQEQPGYLEFTTGSGFSAGPLHATVAGAWRMLRDPYFQVDVDMRIPGQLPTGALADASVSDFTGLFLQITSSLEGACTVSGGLVIRIGKEINVNGYVWRRLDIWISGTRVRSYAGYGTKLFETSPDPLSGRFIEVPPPEGPARLRAFYKQGSVGIWFNNPSAGVTLSVPFTPELVVKVGGFVQGQYKTLSGSRATIDFVSLQYGKGSISPRDLRASQGSSQTKVPLSWASMLGAGASKYLVYRDGNLIADDVLVTTYEDISATAGVVHEYQVAALYPDLGTTSNACAPVEGWLGLPAPDGVTASKGTSESSIAVTWNATPGVEDYELWRTATGGQPVLVTTTDATSHTDSVAPPGKLCTYQVKSIKGAIKSALSIPNAASQGFRKLPAPGSVAASDGTSASAVAVTWASVSGATQYEVWRSIGGAAATKLATVGPTSYNDTSVPAAVEATYTVKAKGASAEFVSDFSAVATGWKSLPAVKGVVASLGTNTAGVQLSWPAVAGATGYRVLRGGESVGTTVNASFIDASVNPGTLSSYVVKASCALGDGIGSTAVSGWRGLLAPSACSATAGVSASFVRVTWESVVGAAGYQILRAAGGAAAQIAAVNGALSVQFDDTTATPGVLYSYTVRAVGGTGTGSGAASTTATGWRMLGVPVSVVATDGTRLTDVQVTWGAVTGAVKYQVIRDGVDLALVNAPVRTYADISAVPATSYTYTVKAVGAVGTGSSAASAPNAGYRGLSAPAGVSASDGTSASEVTLAWAASPGATGYKVFRSGSATPIGTPATNSFSDTTAVLGVKYTYTVRATAAGVTDSALSRGDSGWRSLAAPLGVAATDDDTAKVMVTWSAVAGSRGYFVYRGPAGGALVKLRPTPVTGTSFDDLTAVPGTLYDYAVSASCALGECVRSAPNEGLRPLSILGDGPMAGGMPSGGGDTGATGRGIGSEKAGAEPPTLSGVELYLWMITQEADVPVACGSEQPLQTGDGQRSDSAEFPDGRTDGIFPVGGTGDSAEAEVQEEISPAAVTEAIDTDANGEPDICQLRRGDMNLDGEVDGADVALLLLLIGNEPVLGIGDLDGDGQIGPEDAMRLVEAASPSASGSS